MKKIVTTVLMLLILLVAQATVRYVKPIAAGSGNGSNWANASADIQAMINASAANDQVWVAGGRYVPNRRLDAPATITLSNRGNTFLLKKDVKLYGGFAGTETLLTQRSLALTANASTLSGDFLNNDGANLSNITENTSHVVVSVGNVGAAVLDGFTLSGGYGKLSDPIITIGGIDVAGSIGAGIHCASSSPTLSNLIVTNNEAEFRGGGISISDNFLQPQTCSNITAFGNNSYFGGGLATVVSQATFTNCAFTGNIAAQGGGIYNSKGASVFTNVVVSGNSASKGGGVFADQDSSVFTNTTISGNKAEAIYLASAKLKLRNSIVYGNMSGITATDVAQGPNSSVIEYSLVQGTSASSPGNMDGATDPIFTSPVSYTAAPTTAGTYSLSVCSPAANVGSNTFYGVAQIPNLTAITTDFVGISRFYNTGTVDMGAYEVQTTGTILYVKAGATGNGYSWATASGDIQAMINLACNSGTAQIWVAGGTYKPNRRMDATGVITPNDRYNTFLLKKNVKVYGGFVGTETLLSERNLALTANTSTLSGDFLNNDGADFANIDENAGHVVLSTGDVGTAALDGFTISGGAAYGLGDLTVNGISVTGIQGAGVYCISSSPTLSNLIVTKNYTDYLGGGILMYNNASQPQACSNIAAFGNYGNMGGGLAVVNTQASFTNCSFTGNTALAGGGIYSSTSTAVYTNIVVTGNTAIKGGGLYNYLDNSLFINTTVSGNNGEGIYLESAHLKLRNSIVYGNASGINATNVSQGPNSSVIEYSLVQGLTASAPGNIDGATDPIFASPVAYTAAPTTTGTYSLSICSPAINSGSNTYYGAAQTPNLTAITTDFVGNSRIYNSGTVDMGAYEYQSVAATSILYVKPGASGNGYSWPTASGDIQAMINLACSSGTTQVWVAGGTYLPNRRADAVGTITPADRNNAFVLKNNVLLYGGFAGTETLLGQRNLSLTANASTLSADFNGDDLALSYNTENAYHLVISAGAVGAATLDGFTIKGGNAAGSGSITVNGQTVAVALGGGMQCRSSSPLLANLKFSYNRSNTHGGGLSNISSSPTCTQLVFTNNYAGSNGGGMANFTSSVPTCSNCVFNANSCANNGGAIYNSASAAVFTNTLLTENYAVGLGGAVYNGSSAAIFTNATISGNSASGAGGAVANFSAAAIFTNVVITGNQTYFSSGGGVYNFSSPAIFTNVTISGNLAAVSGSGMYNEGSNIKLRNSIVFGNLDGITNVTSTPAIEYSLVQGLAASAPGNMDGAIDPGFVSPAAYTDAPTTAGTYSLSLCSPVINAGSNGYYAAAQTPLLTAVTNDVAGAGRFYGGGLADMGAYEYQLVNSPYWASQLAYALDAATVSIAGGSSSIITPGAFKCRLIATVASQGASPVSGVVDAKVWVDATVQTQSGSPYVQRHYEIQPATNATTATARVTLYFTQTEFDNYNTAALASINLWVPGSPTDAVGKASLRIYKYSGVSSNGTGTPASYPGTSSVIDPDDNDIVWNSSLNRWEVTFNTTGFSGFFVAGVLSGILPLPVQLLSFTGSLTQDKKAAKLQWAVAEQRGIKEYVVETAVDGGRFTDIGTVAANNLTEATYNYTDNPALTIHELRQYRLRIVTIDGKNSYSRVISLITHLSSLITAYPLPATNEVWLKGSKGDLIGTDAVLVDMQGRIMQKIHISGWPQRINISSLAAGVYFVKMNNDTLKVVIKR